MSRLPDPVRRGRAGSAAPSNSSPECRMYRRVLSLMALLSLVVAVGCKKKKDEGGPGGGLPSVSASTPEEAFNRFKKAMAEEDEKTLLALMTPDQINQSVEQPIRTALRSIN